MVSCVGIDLSALKWGGSCHYFQPSLNETVIYETVNIYHHCLYKFLFPLYESYMILSVVLTRYDSISVIILQGTRKTFTFFVEIELIYGPLYIFTTR